MHSFILFLKKSNKELKSKQVIQNNFIISVLREINIFLLEGVVILFLLKKNHTLIFFIAVRRFFFFFFLKLSQLIVLWHSVGVLV
ncbi:hypothetical protein EDC94DRAFT_598745, partial [Helicostylum pulchrum]